MLISAPIALFTVVERIDHRPSLERLKPSRHLPEKALTVVIINPSSDAEDRRLDDGMIRFDPGSLRKS
jgi:hypothetical protein